MGIKRFAKIKGVGRLANCTQKGPQLERYNLFYAENGRGKTTLCAILRSLQTGEHVHIIERTTLPPEQHNPEVQILLHGGNQLIYKERRWSNTMPEIQIFDADFVARNVYAGEYVERDHRKNLLQVMIGEEGVRRSKAVDGLDRAIREKTADIKRARDAVKLHLSNDTKFEKFLTLEENLSITRKIEMKKKELKAAEQAEKIKTQSELVRLVMPSLPENFELVLSKTLANVSADAETDLKRQIEKHKMQDHGQAWLSEGIGYIYDDECPFCGQDIKGIFLIETYKKFFSKSYTSLIEEIDQFEKTIRDNFGDTAFAGLRTIFIENKNNILFWEQFVEFKVNEIDFANMVIARAKKLHCAMLALIKSKQKNPLTKVVPSHEFQTAKAEYENAVSIIKIYNDEIVMANNIITDEKEKVKSVNVVAIKKEIIDLKLIERRHTPEMKILCDEYQSLNLEKEELDDEKGRAKRELDSYVDENIKNYEETINKLLYGFGANFSIANSSKNYVGGTPVSSYQIVISDYNNCPVDLGDRKTPLGEHCFRTTLSAGDRSCLALAFFLAQLEHNPNKADCIIVFDDPFSSLDSFRQHHTAYLLRKYAGICAQMLLFSHNPDFLNSVGSELPEGQICSLRLWRASNQETAMEKWDMEREIQNGYIKDHEALSSYFRSGSKDLNLIDVSRKIRPVLEGYIRRRFPAHHRTNERLGEMIEKIRELADLHPAFPIIDELEEINEFSRTYHHASKGETNDNQLYNYVRRTINIVEER